jgi:alkylation response protein AidB-like acyl-CoA dehydrogenase
VLNWTLQGSHALGVARHAFAALVEVAASKTPTGTTAVLRERAPVQGNVGQAQALVEAARHYLYGTVAAAWEDLLAGRHPGPAQRAQVRLAAAHAVTCALQAVQLLHQAADSSAVYATNPLERCWRDLTTAATHGGIGWRVYEGAGRIALGLEAPAVIFS